MSIGDAVDLAAIILTAALALAGLAAAVHRSREGR